MNIEIMRKSHLNHHMVPSHLGMDKVFMTISIIISKSCHLVINSYHLLLYKIKSKDSEGILETFASKSVCIEKRGRLPSNSSKALLSFQIMTVKNGHLRIPKICYQAVIQEISLNENEFSFEHQSKNIPIELHQENSLSLGLSKLHSSSINEILVYCSFDIISVNDHF